jgi:hypothetical protein
MRGPRFYFYYKTQAISNIWIVILPYITYEYDHLLTFEPRSRKS